MATNVGCSQGNPELSLDQPVGGGSEDEVVEDGGVRSDADAAADHHGHLELVPVLVAAAERALDSNLLSVEVFNPGQPFIAKSGLIKLALAKAAPLRIFLNRKIRGVAPL